MESTESRKKINKKTVSEKSDPEPQQEVPKLEEQFPSVEIAYLLSLDSYKIVRERFDAMEKRGQTIIVFFTTISLAIITIVAKDKSLSFKTTWFILASLSYIVMLVFGIISQTSGTLIFPNPKLIYEKTLSWSKWEFQKNLIYQAGEHYEHNLEQIDRRWKIVNISACFGLVTLFSLAIWISQ